MWYLCRCLFFVFCTSLLAMTAKFSLQDAVQYGVQNSPNYNSAQRQKSIKELEYRNSIYSFFPKIDVSATQGVSKYDPKLSENPWDSTLDVSSTLSIYDNGSTINDYKSASKSLDIADLEFNNYRENYALEISKLFYQYSRQVELLKLEKEQFYTLKNQFKLVSRLYKQGLRTRVDFLRLKTNLKRSELDIKSQEADILKKINEIKTAIYFQKDTDFLTISDKPMKISSIPLKAISLDNHYEYRIAELNKELNDLNVFTAKRNYWPQIDLRAGIYYDKDDYIGDPRTNTTQWSGRVALTFTYNIWDWGVLRRKYDVALEEKEVSNNEQKISILELETRLKNLLLNLHQLKENYANSIELYKIEKKSFNFVDEEYKKGRSSYIDWISSLKNLTSARATYLRVHYSLLSTIAEYRYHEGKLYETFF
jgi:outer membrane protein TolC